MKTQLYAQRDLFNLKGIRIGAGRNDGSTKVLAEDGTEMVQVTNIRINIPAIGDSIIEIEAHELNDKGQPFAGLDEFGKAIVRKKRFTGKLEDKMPPNEILKLTDAERKAPLGKIEFTKPIRLIAEYGKEFKSKDDGQERKTTEANGA